MNIARLLYDLFRPRGILDYLVVLLGLGLLLLANTLATMLIATLIGAYLSLALSAIIVWISLFLVFGSLLRHIRKVKEAAKEGNFPTIDFMHLSGLVVATVCMVVPGYFTTVVGWVTFMPPIRLAIGALILRKYEPDFTILYEHLQAHD